MQVSLGSLRSASLLLAGPASGELCFTQVAPRCMPGGPHPLDMNAHTGSGSDDEPALRVPPESDELADEARPVAHFPGRLSHDWPEEREQREDESVAQILAGVSSSHANPNFQGRWVDADRSVSPPFLESARL